MIQRYTVICLMALFILFVIHLFIINLNYAAESVASPNPSVESGLAILYTTSDKVIILTPENFNQNVYNSTSSWLVQFYNSWCGHCKNFSPHWKELAADTENWRSVIKFGVVNCADEENTQHCREYDIMGYPTIRFFQPRTANFTVGKDMVPASREDPEILRQGILAFLETITLDTPVRWPVLPPIHRKDIDLIVADKNILEFLLIVEEDTSYVGRDLIMDVNHLSWLAARRILRKDYPTNETFQLFAVTKKEYSIPIPVADQSRVSVFEAVRKFYKGKGYTIEAMSLPKKTNDTVSKSASVQTLEQKSMVHSLFQTDIESALIYSLGHEIPLKARIEGAAFSSLINYLTIVHKYFPFVSEEGAFVERVIHALNSRTSVAGGEFRRMLDEQGRAFIRQPKTWLGCAGSEGQYRGYTCGLWMMFHTLTIRRYAKETQSQPPALEILSAIAGYIENFFGCHDCAEHFIAMSKTIDGNVTSVPDDVLWLWKAHNTVNRRLAGDKSEDPAFPKQQFPHRDVCARCRDANGSWNESEVLHFLVSMYTHLTPRNRTNEQKAEKMIGRNEEETEGSWNFGLTDVNACIGLYMLSACLLTVYTVRLFLKRSPRFKHHKYDYATRA